MAEAFACELLEKYREALLSKLCRHGYDLDTAEDALQIVGLQLAKTAVVIDDGHPFGYFASAVFRQAKALRERTSVFASLDEPAAPGETDGEALVDRLADPRPGPEVLVADEELLRVVADAAAELGSRERFIVARLVTGDNVVRIGLALGLGRQQAATLTNRARRELAKRLPAELVPASVG